MADEALPLFEYLRDLTAIRPHDGWRNSARTGEAEAFDYLAGMLGRFSYLESLGLGLQRQSFPVFAATELRESRLYLTSGGQETEVAANALAQGFGIRFEAGEGPGPSALVRAGHPLVEGSTTLAMVPDNAVPFTMARRLVLTEDAGLPAAGLVALRPLGRRGVGARRRGHAETGQLRAPRDRSPRLPALAGRLRGRRLSGLAAAARRDSSPRPSGGRAGRKPVVHHPGRRDHGRPCGGRRPPATSSGAPAHIGG